MASSFPNILIAPLNWGLGHATRCIPIINALLDRGIRPILASDGAALALLREEYPELKILDLPAYNIKYHGNSMMLTMGVQLPKIGKAILSEQQAIKKIVGDHQIDLIISDNRYGVFHPDCHSIFMTHQLNIKIPNRILEKMVARINHRLIRRFDACWVPDYAKEPRLAGTLSENPGFSKIEYLGPLSRMEKAELNPEYKLAIVLSGPEPQRTNLEKILFQQLSDYSEKVCFIRGVISDALPPIVDNKNISVINYLTATKLNQVLNASEMVLCRSGYSSLMDLVKLNKRAVLIPTPGQTEQENLADYLSKIGSFAVANQRDFNLKDSLATLDNIVESTWPKGKELEAILEKTIRLLKNQPEK